MPPPPSRGMQRLGSPTTAVGRGVDAGRSPSYRQEQRSKRKRERQRGATRPSATSSKCFPAEGLDQGGLGRGLRRAKKPGASGIM